jgi:hypothetical protein
MFTLPPTSAETHRWSDAKLTSEFAQLNLTVTKDTFGALVQGTAVIDDLLDRTWSIGPNDHRGDKAHFFALEAQRRWRRLRLGPKA